MEYIKKPMGIEVKSFEIIGEEMGPHSFNERELTIIKRVIHTTADFEYKDITYIREGSIDAAGSLLKEGIKIYTDTKMALSGMNKSALEKLGCEVVCYVGDEDVTIDAKKRGITRSMAGVEKAVEEGIQFYVFGNAPTALFRLKELMLEGKANVKFVIGAPIGFVGAAESKEEIEKMDIPMITVRGRKGGSTVAASIVNALMYLNVDRN